MTNRKGFPQKSDLSRAVTKDFQLSKQQRRNDCLIFADCLGTPNPYNVSEKYWRYASNLYRSTPPTCNAVPRWLLSFGERETPQPQYTSNLYCRLPPICTGDTPPICTGDTLEKIPGVGGSGKLLIINSGKCGSSDF